MLLLLLASLSFAASDQPPVTLAGTLAAGFGPPSVGVIGSLHAAWHPGRFGVELIGREGWWSADARSVGSIGLAARCRITPVWFARAGFVHNHEVPREVLADAPVASVAGTAEGIVHRSGFEVGGGADWPLKVFGDRWGWRAEVGVSVFPDAHHPVVYGYLEQGLSFDIGRRKPSEDEG